MVKAIASHFFKSAFKQAQTVSTKPNKVLRLIQEVTAKAKTVATKNNLDHLMTMVRMLKAYYKKEYTVLPWKTILLFVAALLYFVSPFDLVPDFIPFGGLVDDFTVLTWVFKQSKADVDAFATWELANFTRNKN